MGAFLPANRTQKVDRKGVFLTIGYIDILPQLKRGSQNSLQRGNELTPVIPGFILVIPAKAGIHTDSPPEPYCPVPPWPCHPREGRDPPLALDSRLRGNDDLRAWERAVGVLRHPLKRVLQNPGSHTFRPCGPQRGNPYLSHALESAFQGEVGIPTQSAGTSCG
ncbi:hypothetical protein [Endozoicomonas sp. 8E]|uniref:hypothetical protein n=1 Tax=Endozoicomonas sp. 8E TaxID=3035692 RepID=UPI0029394C95|nr:hypothetical protein [Endozoicomonas sp. 8E]WOG29051.1 hypothetical protein P6910_05140 [Endozoicomonas sp. 8E]